MSQGSTKQVIPTSILSQNAITAANSSFVIPASAIIRSMTIENATANAITGGMKIGTTAGGTDVVLALAVAGNAMFVIPDATLLKKIFSKSASQILYIDAVTLWNSASVNISIIYDLI